MRVSAQKLNDSLKRQIGKTLVQVFADIKSAEEMEKFLEDFLTSGELEILSKRLAIAYWLKKGRSYDNIKQNLKVSSATIAAVQSSMDKAGFQKAIKMIEAEEWATQWAEKIKKFVRT